MISLPAELRERAARVRALVLDVDGVLTDGSLVYGADGEALKIFDVKDGLGLRLLTMAGIKVALISARTSPPLLARISDMHVDHALLGRRDKRAALEELVHDAEISREDIAYAGDDLVDVPVLAEVGLPIAVADAHPRVRAKAAWITRANGGRGAVREIAEDLLEARGELDAICAKITGER